MKTCHPRHTNWNTTFAADMKEIYHAATLQAAEQAIEYFEKKWNHKYAYAVRSWRNNWVELTQFFDYPLEIRKIVYTTNVIESLNRGICSQEAKIQ